MAFVQAPLPSSRPRAARPARRHVPLCQSGDAVHTARKRARSAPPTRRLASDVARRAAHDARQAPQRRQWDVLLAAALAEPQSVEPSSLFRPAEPVSSGLLHVRAPRSAPDASPARERPLRKPHGFWNDLANVERELLLVNAQLGRPGKKIVPRLSEMAELGRGDLVAAIGKHGGVKKVADALRWGRGGKTRRAVSALSAAESKAKATKLKSTGIRDKLLRRPRSYWDDIERVQSEIGAFVAEYGVSGVMPTQKQFYSFERADLVQAASRHGGLRVLAQSMGLRCRRAPKKRMYWKDFDVLKKALIEFSNEHCPGRMPTGEELRSRGGSAITNAIAAHGGFPTVASMCGLAARNTRSQGAPKTWDVQRLRMELHAFTLAHFPTLARTKIIPTERQLRKHGRNDLSYAINKFGGYAKVARELGLSQKRHGVFRSNAPVNSDSSELVEGQSH